MTEKPLNVFTGKSFSLQVGVHWCQGIRGLENKYPGYKLGEREAAWFLQALYPVYNCLLLVVAEELAIVL